MALTEDSKKVVAENQTGVKGRGAARRELGLASFFSILLDLSSKSSSQFLIHMPAMADGHQANHPRLAIDGVDDSKAADAILP